MSQSLSKILVHLIFSTKNRAPLIEAEVRAELYAYLGGILQNLQCPSLHTGGTADHVHTLISLSRTHTIADVMEELKKSSSKWMKEQGTRAFAWQAGYGAFSVSQSQASHVVRYIANQETHHRKKTFKDEYRQFLEQYGVAYDERYVWD